jgi:hypothetical protein
VLRVVLNAGKKKPSTTKGLFGDDDGEGVGWLK